MQDRNLLLLGAGLVIVFGIVFGIIIFSVYDGNDSGTKPMPGELVCCILIQDDEGNDVGIDYIWNGEWKYDRYLEMWLPHGQGTLETMYAVYQGLYVDGMLEGRGNSHHKVEGVRCTNEYVNGERQGKGSCIADDGREWYGEWKDDGRFPHNGIMMDESGKIIIEYKDGEEIEM